MKIPILNIYNPRWEWWDLIFTIPMNMVLTIPIIPVYWNSWSMLTRIPGKSWSSNWGKITTDQARARGEPRLGMERPSILNHQADHHWFIQAISQQKYTMLNPHSLLLKSPSWIMFCCCRTLHISMFGRAVRGYVSAKTQRGESWHSWPQGSGRWMDKPSCSWYFPIGIPCGIPSYETLYINNEIIMGCLHIFTIYWCGISQPQYHPSQGGFVVSLWQPPIRGCCWDFHGDIFLGCTKRSVTRMYWKIGDISQYW